MILCYEVINLKKLREQLKTLSKYVNVIFDLTNIDLHHAQDLKNYTYMI